jgi:tryptophan synthase alpha chain
MQNRIIKVFQNKSSRLLNVYFTAGFPNRDDTRIVLQALQDAGVDFVEIGMPYSDPVADGETIQQANQQALDNGMSLNLLFKQLEGIRPSIKVPILLMGYVNPVLQLGVENFCKKCKEIGIDGVILPDIPLSIYMDEFKDIFEQYGLLNIFLITPQTTEERIRQIDDISQGFIYMVSSASVTGAKSNISTVQESYFERIAAMNLKNPRLIGFGISDADTFQKACMHSSGAIIGSAFIKMLETSNSIAQDTKHFIQSIRGQN